MTISQWQAGSIVLPGTIVSRLTSPAYAAGSITNTGFESGDSGWVKGTGWAINEDAAYLGTWSAAYTAVAVAAAIENDNYAVIVPGQSVTLLAMCDRGADIEGGGQGAVQLSFYDSGNTLISTSSGIANTTGGPGEWYQVSVTAVAPPLAAYVRAGAQAYATAGTVRFDAFTWNLSNVGASGLVFQSTQAESGLTGTSEPTWPTAAAGTVVDNEVTWTAITATTVTWQASPLLVSGSTEPTWPTVAGAGVANGTISWETVRLSIEDVNCPNTREVAIGASKIFAGDYDIVRFSATLNARDWTTQEDAGFLPTGLHQGEQVGVTALGVYRGNLAVWSESSFQVWQIDPDPSAMALLDAMEGIGSSHHKAVQPVSNDLFFLAALGVRTVGVAAASTNLATGDAGIPIDTLVQADMNGDVDPIATYYPSMGQYWVAFPSYTESVPGENDPDVTGVGPTDPDAIPPDTGLPDITFVLAWWEFEEAGSENPGPSLLDEVNSYILFPANGYTSSIGVNGLSATVTAASSRDLQSSQAATTLPAEFTLLDQVWGTTFWWKTPPSLTGMEDTHLVSSWAESSPVVGQRKWRIIYNAAANGFICSMGKQTPAYTFVSIDTGDIGVAASSWYHFAMTHDPVANEMSLTVSKRGSAVTGTRLTATVIDGAFPGTPETTMNIDQPIYVGRDLNGNFRTNGTIDMLAFWGGTAILSEEGVSLLHLRETTYAELADLNDLLPTLPPEIIIPYWDNLAGNGWIDLDNCTIQSFATTFGAPIEGVDFDAVKTIGTDSAPIASLVNTYDGGNRLRLNGDASFSEGILLLCNESGVVLSYQYYDPAVGDTTDYIEVPTGGNYYIVSASDTGSAMVEKWDISGEVNLTGSVSWLSFFGTEFGSGTISDVTKIIPAAGIAISFTIPITATAITVGFVSIGVTGVASSRTGSISQRVGEYNVNPKYTWGLGGGISGVINQPSYSSNQQWMHFYPGQTYVLNIKNNTPAVSNWIRVQAAYRAV